MNKRMIINIGGLLLCLFFFVAPLVQCSQDSSLSATGLQISTGTGDLMGSAETSYPVVFVLLIVPAILAIIGFSNKPFTMLRNTSIGGLAAQILFMISAYAMLNSGEYRGAFVLTVHNWLILAIYIGLIILIQHCIKEAPTPENTIEGDKGENFAIHDEEPTYITKVKINLYGDPNNESGIKTTIEANQVVVLLKHEFNREDRKNWYNIQTKNGDTGWCISEYLKPL